MKLDRLSTRNAIRLMLQEETRVPLALLRELPAIERAVKAITHALRSGGRLFYVGAGTSGRLAMLDATECPPTFSSPPEMVQCILAGGKPAVWSSLERAEDDAGAAATELKRRRLSKKDVLLGISASGTTPFVWGALCHAQSVGARSILLTCNPSLEITRSMRPKIIICPDTGPEVLTGSTRLKAGTATKVLLNLFSTLAMVRLGKVRSNLMIDVVAGNEKLRARAVRILSELTGADETSAQEQLARHKWHLRSVLEASRAPKKRQLSRRRTPKASPDQ